MPSTTFVLCPHSGACSFKRLSKGTLPSLKEAKSSVESFILDYGKALPATEEVHSPCGEEKLIETTYFTLDLAIVHPREHQPRTVEDELKAEDLARIKNTVFVALWMYDFFIKFAADAEALSNTVTMDEAMACVRQWWREQAQLKGLIKSRSKRFPEVGEGFLAAFCEPKAWR